ncbi:MAG TPA: invasion associated locus B family protein [Rhizomicrobium sp.]|nr:invasion associated locus B family protein [Rhizomicrobium sp.]
MKTTVRFLLAAALSLCATPVFAQAQAAPPKPDVSKQVGDWLVRCYPVQSPSPCDMFELLAQKKTGNRVMSISLAYAPKAGKYVVQIAVPLGVELKKGLVIKAGEYASPAMQFRRCDRGGCYVEGLTDTGLMDALAQNGEAGKATISSTEGRSLDISFSLRGFGDARNQMVELARQKAANPPAQPAQQ